jgi:hypothetical protein
MSIIKGTCVTQNLDHVTYRLAVNDVLLPVGEMKHYGPKKCLGCM